MAEDARCRRADELVAGAAEAAEAKAAMRPVAQLVINRGRSSRSFAMAWLSCRASRWRTRLAHAAHDARQNKIRIHTPAQRDIGVGQYIRRHVAMREACGIIRRKRYARSGRRITSARTCRRKKLFTCLRATFGVVEKAEAVSII